MNRSIRLVIGSSLNRLPMSVPEAVAQFSRADLRDIRHGDLTIRQVRHFLVWRCAELGRIGRDKALEMTEPLKC